MLCAAFVLTCIQAPGVSHAMCAHTMTFFGSWQLAVKLLVTSEDSTTAGSRPCSGVAGGENQEEPHLGTSYGEASIPQHSCESGEAAEAVHGLHMHLQAAGEAPLNGGFQHGSKLLGAPRVPGEAIPRSHIVLLGCHAVAGLDGCMIHIIVQVG